MKLLYFASLRDRLGVAEEEVSPPPEISDVAGLVAWLRQRGGNFEAALEDMSAVRVAVNQEHVGFDHAVAAGDEIALFPPVTGG
ncbi:MAG: molybdopterin converting factor subunit 1 [Rhodospirillales bacterium]|jgi:molybdopterin synthase sulfur carrier subunit|nr:molybdopterin converting factor subunit 1 [Rhodospirillales bacterium]